MLLYSIYLLENSHLVCEGEFTIFCMVFFTHFSRDWGTFSQHK